MRHWRSPLGSRRSSLRRRRARLLLQLQELREPDPGPALEDESRDTWSFDAFESLRARLDRVDAALARLDHGAYGDCVDCGREIEPAWLDEVPEAERCAACESALRRAAPRRALHVVRD